MPACPPAKVMELTCRLPTCRAGVLIAGLNRSCHSHGASLRCVRGGYPHSSPPLRLANLTEAIRVTRFATYSGLIHFLKRLPLHCLNTPLLRPMGRCSCKMLDPQIQRVLQWRC